MSELCQGRVWVDPNGLLAPQILTHWISFSGATRSPKCSFPCQRVWMSWNWDPAAWSSHDQESLPGLHETEMPVGSAEQWRLHWVEIWIWKFFGVLLCEIIEYYVLYIMINLCINVINVKIFWKFVFWKLIYVYNWLYEIWKFVFRKMIYVFNIKCLYDFQKSSEVIRSHQKSSEVIRSRQKSSRVTKSHQELSTKSFPFVV